MVDRFSRRFLALLVVAALLVGGCTDGGTSRSSTVSTIGILGAALADTAEASTYRWSASIAYTLKFPGLDIEVASESNKQSPTMTGEFSPDREHFVIDMGDILEPIIGGFGEGFELEIWVEQERMVMDWRAPQWIMNMDSSFDSSLMPITPGISFIDLAVLDKSSPELVGSISRYSVPDLREMAEKLPAILTTIKRLSTEPQVFTGSAKLADLYEALGMDIEDQARSEANAIFAGMAPDMQIDMDSIVSEIINLYEITDAEITIELDEQGLLKVLNTKMDLSGIFDLLHHALFSDEEAIPLPEDVTDDYAGTLVEQVVEKMLEEANNIFKDAEFIMEIHEVYQVDADLEVPLPPETTNDQTEQWREFLLGTGFNS